MRPQAFLLERLPNPPLTRDQLTMLTLGDNVVGDGGVGQARLGLRDLVTARPATRPGRRGERT